MNAEPQAGLTRPIETGLPAGPCPDAIAAVNAMTEAMYDVAYVGDLNDGEVKASICAAVREMSQAGTTVEAALACVKYRLRRVTMGGALDIRDDLRVAWLSDHLVRWVIECYY